MSELDDAATYQAVRSHLQRFWPDRRQEEFAWMLGPISESLPQFRVRRIAPEDPSDPWIYVTVGAWVGDRDPAHGTEFFLLAPEENALHVELLSMVANLHADPQHTLTLGNVLEIGRGWREGATADHLLVSLPYPYGPALEWCHAGTRHVRFLWLVPITATEAQFVRKKGLEALERLFEQQRVDMVASNRSSVA